MSTVGIVLVYVFFAVAAGFVALMMFMLWRSQWKEEQRHEGHEPRPLIRRRHPG